MNKLSLAALTAFVALGFTGMAAAQPSNSQVDTVMMASTANYPDALISGAPSERIGAPVLLTDKDTLSSSASNAMDRLEPSDVVIVGGPMVVSENVQATVEQRANVTRLWGTTQIGTSIEVAEYFYPDTDEAVIVQYPQENDSHRMLGAVKNRVDGDAPVLISKEGTLSASVLSHVSSNNITDVEVYSTDAVNVSQDLREVGVEEVEVKEQGEEDLVRDLNNEIEHSSERLVVVASGGWQDAISAPSQPNGTSLLVSSESEIQDAVEAARNLPEDAEIQVVGKPDLASQIASRIMAETGREVERVSGSPEDVSAAMARNSSGEWRALQQERMASWRSQVNSAPGQERAANRTIASAEGEVDQNSSEESRELLREAREAYSEGEYFEARKLAIRARSEARVREFRGVDGEELHERIREEREDMQEAAREIRETNTEMAQELREAETAEERLEIIREAREERRETRRDLREERRERINDTRERTDDIRDEYDGDEAGNSELKLRVEGNEVSGEVEYSAPTAGYTMEDAADASGDRVTFRFNTVSPDGMAATVISEVESRRRLQLEDGNYTARIVFSVDGTREKVLTQEITVPGTAEYSTDTEDGSDDTGDDSSTNETDDGQ